MRKLRNLTNEDDKNNAVERVISFTTAMNDWQTRKYFRMRIEYGNGHKNKHSVKLAGPLSLSQLDQQYWKIFSKHCTDRKRSYAGPESCRNPPQYDGVDINTIIDVARVKPRRIEVICGIGKFPNDQFKFVLFKKLDNWLIDNAFIRIEENSPWRRHNL